MGQSNYDWAALVMSRTPGPKIPITTNNVVNFTAWMRAENPDTDWWHLNNPLNCGLNDGSADGTGSYPDLDYAATETASVLGQANMSPIANALRMNASKAVFSAGCADSAWSTGGYHGNPGYILAVPDEPVIDAPFTFSSVPAPTNTPPPSTNPGGPPLSDFPNSVASCEAPGGGTWVVGRDGGVFCSGGAPFYGSLPGDHVAVGTIIDIAASWSGKGYYMVGSDGGVFCFGDAAFFGSYPSLPAAERQGNRTFGGRAISLHWGGGGYDLVALDGAKYGFGA